MTPSEHIEWALVYALDALLAIGVTALAVTAGISLWVYWRNERAALDAPADIPETPEPRALLRPTPTTPLPAETVLQSREEA